MAEKSFEPSTSESTHSLQPKLNNWLLQHRRIVTSQTGEDGIIEKIFELIPNSDRWCVEFGALDGMTYSNTHNLIVNHSWSSIQIEGSHRNWEILSARYADNPNIICINKWVAFEGDDRFDGILANTSVPKNFDLLSIDIDGNDYHVWESIHQYKPKLVVIEFNPTVPNQVEFIQPNNPNVQQGSSLLAMINLGKRKGYELICATDWNGFFIDKKYYDLFGIQDNSIWQLYDNREYMTYVFQLFDGTIVLGGCNRLLWHGIELDLETIQEEIQVLPEELRSFPSF